MRLIYNFGIRLLYLAIKIAAVKNNKARLWINGRKQLFKQIKQGKDPAEKTIWFHCASLGEFEQGRPLIEEVRSKFPEKKIAVTFFSPSGYEVRKNYQGADYVYYLPLDTVRNAKKFIRILNPEKAFFIKYEYWYNVLFELKKQQVPVFFVSSIFRKDQIFFKKHGAFFCRMLGLVTHFFLQNKQSAALLDSINVHHYSVTGDTRFDRVAHVFENGHPLKVAEKFLNGSKAIIAGSSWKAEEALLLQFLRKYPGNKLIIVPHEVSEENITRLEKQFGQTSVRYSRAENESLSKKTVLIIDCYGLLSSLYRYGKLAVVGGGFGVGIHNVLEPAAFGLPVVFGSNYQRFKEAVDLVELKCAYPVQNIAEFNEVLHYLLSNEDELQALSNTAAKYVRDNIGATRKIIARVFNT
ncbi:MAG: 3-deoxy-D-manno-octulosonic acid transferase [Prolixibacteraceae bacterium]|nr:3-deoxy-D-manno-octulosonic acid transferase [Prolixibacteraceae bacterium]